MKFKKGILSIFSFLMLFIALSYFLIMVHSQYRDEIAMQERVGQRQIDLKNLYLKGEIDLLYYDSLSNIVFPNSLYKLSYYGGFYGLNECDYFVGTPLWINDLDFCKPNYLNSLGLFFSKNINRYTKNEIDFYFSYVGRGIMIASAIDSLNYEKNYINYSLRPNFKFNSGYDLNIYETAFKKAEEIADLCENKEDFSFCVKERLAHYSRMNENFEWKEECKTNEERIFYSFVKQIEKCLNSVGNNCSCEIDMKNIENYNDVIDLKIKIESNGNISFNNLYHQFDKNLASYGLIEQYSTFNEIYVLLKYENGHLINLGITSNENIESDQLSLTNTNKDLFLYKSNKSQQNNLENYFFITDKENLRDCRTFTRHATICIKNQNEFLIYDFNHNRLEHKKIPLQFSIYVPDNIPPDPIEFNIEKTNNENELKLFFNRSLNLDINYYKIYVENQNINSLFMLTPNKTISDFDLNGFEQEIILKLEKEELPYFITIVPEDVFGNVNNEFVIFEIHDFDNLIENSENINDLINHFAFEKDIEPEKLFAILEVQSSNQAFYSDGHPLVNFDCSRYNLRVNEDEKVPCEINDDFPFGILEHTNYDAFKNALNLNRNQALLQTRFGLSQIRGLNYNVVGYSSVEEFYTAMFNEINQIEVFFNFILENNQLYNELKNENTNWDIIAHFYAGPGYAQINHHVKLENAYNELLLT